MSREHQDWLRDQEAEREIRVLRAAIKAALANEAFRFRATSLSRLERAERQLERDQQHIVAVWN